MRDKEWGGKREEDENRMYKFQEVNSITCNVVYIDCEGTFKTAYTEDVNIFPLYMYIYKSYALVKTNQNMLIPFIPVAI